MLSNSHIESSSIPHQPDKQEKPGENQTVFIVDDDSDLLKSMTFLLESCNLNVKSYSSAEAFLDDLNPCADGCAILDITLGGMNGIDLQHRLLELKIMFPIFFLTANTELPKAIAAMKKGAMHHLLKSASNEEIMAQVFESLKYSRKIQLKNREIIHVRNLIKKLSPREFEVMNYVVDGKKSREIAETLNIKVKTVEAHRLSMRGKMDVTNTAKLINKILVYRRNESEQE